VTTNRHQWSDKMKWLVKQSRSAPAAFLIVAILVDVARSGKATKQPPVNVALRRLLVSVISRSRNDSPYGYSTALIVTLITFVDYKLFKINRVRDYWPSSLQSRTTCQRELPHDDRPIFLFINITSHTRSLFETNSDKNINCNRPR